MKTIEIPFSIFESEEAFHEAFAELMGFPGFYGRNWDAWIDCMPELKRRIWGCVEQDDDILTQFMEADEIKAALDKATDFEPVAALVRRMGEEQDAAE